MYVAVTVFLVVVVCCEGATTTLNLEAESGSSNGRRMQRSAASGGYNMWLHQNDYVHHTFNTVTECSVSIVNVYYANDGSSDTVEIRINGNIVASFRSVYHTNYGHYWNVIVESGSIGSPARLDPGTHQLEVRAASTDFYGVEIDRVVLQLVCDEPTTPPTTIPPTTSSPTTNPPVTTPTLATVLNLEAEDGDHSGTVRQRSEASGGQNVWLHNGGYLINPFTTNSQCSVSVLNVAYSNDGDSDTVKVQIDGSEIGTFTTTAHSAYGNYWNAILSSGRIGTPIELAPDSHQVQITVINADRYGVEIDKISLGLECERRETTDANPTQDTPTQETPTQDTPTRDTSTPSEPTKDEDTTRPESHKGTPSSSLSSATCCISLFVLTLCAIFI